MLGWFLEAGYKIADKLTAEVCPALPRMLRARFPAFPTATLALSSLEVPGLPSMIPSLAAWTPNKVALPQHHDGVPKDACKALSYPWQ